jgi:hypothetical protein
MLCEYHIGLFFIWEGRITCFLCTLKTPYTHRVSAIAQCTFQEDITLQNLLN